MDAITIRLENLSTRYKELLDSIDLTKFRLEPHKNPVKSYRQHVNKEHDVMIKYFPFQHEGSITIRFNVGRLLHGNNLVNVWSFNSFYIMSKLDCVLKDLMDTSYLPPIRYFMVSRVELQLDIVRKRNEIDELFHIISKISNTKRFTRCYNLDKEGCIYFCTGDDPQECMIVKFYFKLRELHSKGYPVQQYLSDENTIVYNPGDDVLRMEVVLTRKWLNNMFNRLSYTCNSVTGKYEESKIPSGIPTGILDDILDMVFQKELMKEIITEFNLNKTMLTKASLMKHIDKNFKHPVNITVRECIHYLNRPPRTKNMRRVPCKSNIHKYKNDLLASGIHFLYTNSLDLKPVLLDEVLSNLPLLQQENNRLYGKSSTLEDIWRCH